LYLTKGLAIIPLPERSKSPVLPGWTKLRLKSNDLDEHFPMGLPRNVGVLNGEPSGNAVDVDLDCSQAILVAPLLLPPTGWVFGRKSAPSSHWIYKTDLALNAAQVRFPDIDGSVLAELRGTGSQTVVPPSLHQETGEQVTWQQFAVPADVALSDLQHAVGAVASAALVSRHWPEKGMRQDAALALAGGLLRGGWQQGRVERFVEAVALAAHDDEVRKRVEAVGTTAEKLKTGKPTTGWPRLSELLGERGSDVVERVREWLSIDSSSAEPAIPNDAPWPAPLAEEALHGLAGEFVRVVEPHSEADPVALLVQILIGFGAALGRTAHFTVESDRHYLNEFTVLVGDSSKARKGTSWGRCRSVLEIADPIFVQERILGGLSSAEGLIWACRDAISKRHPIREKGRVVSYEEVEEDPGVSDKRLLAFESEFASVLRRIEGQTGNTLSAVLRQAWECGDLRTLVKNSPTKATGAHVAFVTHVTADELRRLLSATEQANGFGNRFCFFCVQRSKQLPEGGALSLSAVEALGARFSQALTFGRSVGEMKRDDQTRALWHEVYGQLSEGKPGLAGGLLARAEAHVMRFSCLYAILDGSAVVAPPHLLAAIALWHYVEQSVRHIFGDSLGDGLADELLRLLRASESGMSRWEMSNALGRNPSAASITRALALLARYRLATVEKRPTGGRPEERWFAVRS
jgi:hypothetical protein